MGLSSLLHQLQHILIWSASIWCGFHVTSLFITLHFFHLAWQCAGFGVMTQGRDGRREVAPIKTKQSKFPLVVLCKQSISTNFSSKKLSPQINKDSMHEFVFSITRVPIKFVLQIGTCEYETE